MSKSIKKYLALKFPLNIVSFVFAYALWCILSGSQVVEHTVCATLSFYNTTSLISIAAPEHVTLTLQGKRSLLKYVRHNALTVHIDARLLTKGTQQLSIDKRTIFLPDSIKLVHYSPTQVTVTHTCI